MSSLRKTHVVHIVWKDAESEDNGWMLLKRAKKYVREPLPTIDSVGFLLGETKDHVTLVHTIDQKNGMVTPAIKIPKAWVVSRKTLK